MLILVVSLGIALASGHAAGGAPKPSTSRTATTDDCPQGCYFRIGIAYCEFIGHIYNENSQDNTSLHCYNLGRKRRVPYFGGGYHYLYIGHALLFAHGKQLICCGGYFQLHGKVSDYRPVSRFYSGTFGPYECRPYSDGARCTVPSLHYPGSLVAIYLTKRGGVWWRRIPA
jgi:hypothetical protein